jgi:hypothetical protein
VTDVVDSKLLREQEDDQVELARMAKALKPDARNRDVEWALLNAIRRYVAFTVQLEALDFAVRNIQHTRGHVVSSDAVQNARNVINDNLLAKRMEAWKDVAMLGHLTNDPVLRKEAVRIATDFLRGEHSAIMRHLDWNGDEPSSYLTDERERFRAEVLTRFKAELNRIGMTVLR